MDYVCAGWRSLTSIVFTLLCCIRTATAQRQCSTFSEVGPVVQLGSNFKVYCVFHKIIKDKCKKSIHMDKKELYNATEHNSTTIFVNIKRITENRTYTCKCACCTEPCGLDLVVGYPPDVPQNVSCTQAGEFGNVTCTWATGRKTYIGTVSKLWVKAQDHDGTLKTASFPGSDSVTFPIFGLHSNYSVWVDVSNKLGAAISPSLNFTLNDIVKPEPLDTVQVNCSARQCVLYWTNKTNSQLLQIKHRCHQGDWRIHPKTDSRMRNISIPDLEPFTVYEFQVRWKLSPDRGLWSDWSRSITSRTDEEAPRRVLDIWFKKSVSPEETSFIVLWKELSESEASGRILGYILTVQDFMEKTVREHKTNNSSLTIACSSCNITVSAYNSKGPSPPAFITIFQEREHPPENVVCAPISNHTIAISWQRPATTGAVKGYLVEWIPTSLQRKFFQWRRVGPDQLKTNITENIQPFECYQGAVYVLYEQGWGKQDFIEAYSWQSAPTAGPVPYVKTLANSVTVSWSGIPWEHQKGCLKGYTIYLRTGGEEKTYGPIGASERLYTITGLESGKHDLFMTARTAAGEGPRGGPVVFFVHLQDDKWTVVITVGILSLFLLMVFIYLCNASSIQHRLSTCLCMMPDSVPDPANSKWAKECTTTKGEMTLEMNLNDSTLSEEPHTMEIEEVEPIWTFSDSKILPSAEGTNKPSTEEGSGKGSQSQMLHSGQPTCPYIKSFSHESGNSDQTESSQITRLTVDYISSGLMDCEEPDDMEFMPSLQSPFLEPLVLRGGKLTLDAVKIDCSEFLY